MSSQRGRRYGVGKPHIFKTRLGWCSVVERNGITSSWHFGTFKTICKVTR